MTNNITIKINGVELEGKQKGVSFSQEFSHSLNTASFVIMSTQEEMFPIFADVEIKVNDNKQYFIVGSAPRVLIDRINKMYRHTITCYEATKYLEKFILPNQEFRGAYKLVDGVEQEKTLLDHFNNALTNAEILYDDENCRFTIDSSLASILETTPAEDISLTQPTLREILDQILKVIDLRCFIERLNDKNNIIISYKDLAHEGETITTIPGITFDEKRSDIEYTSQSLRANVESAISTNRKTITHGYDVFKTIDGSDLTTENMGMILPFPIETLEECILKCHAIIYDQGGQYPEAREFELNITNYIYDLESYNLLTAQEKLLALSYERGSTAIDVSARKKVLFFSFTVLNDVIETEIINVLSAEGNGETYHSTASTLNEMQYKIKYVPFINVVGDVSETFISEGAEGTSQIYAQTDRNISIFRYGENIKSEAEEIGNETWVIDSKCEYDELLHLGDVFQNHVLTSIDYSVFDNYIQAHYIFVKNFSNSQLKISLNREKQIYDIPLNEFVARNNLIKQYCVLSLNNLPNQNDAILNSTALEYMLLSWKNATNYEIKNAYIKTDVMEAEQHYIMDCYTYNLANSINLVFSCLDNYSVGYGIGKRVIGGRKVILNPYCDTLGNYKKIKIIYALGMTNLYHASDVLTKLNALPLAYLNYSIPQELISPNQYFNLYKDAFVKDSFTTQIEFIAKKSEETDIIIGSGIAEINGLIGTAEQLYVYPSNKKFTFNDKNKLLSGEKIAINNSNVIITSNKFEITNLPNNCKAWAIGNEKGKLLLAINNNQNYVYITFSRKII